MLLPKHILRVLENILRAEKVVAGAFDKIDPTEEHNQVYLKKRKKNHQLGLIRREAVKHKNAIIPC